MTTQASRRAQCRCGQLSIVATGEPVRVSVCHCLACKVRTGSAFSYQARFPRSNVAAQGRASQYVRVADRGNRLTYQFCPDCGTTVYYQIDKAPDVVAIPVGGFSQGGYPQPKFSVYESRRNPWVQISADVERMD